MLYPWYVDRARASSFCDSDMKTDFLKLMRNEKRPTMPPFQRPLYSDGGWAILGRVLERLTNLPLNDALQKALSKPLDLNYTAYMKRPGTIPMRLSSRDLLTNLLGATTTRSFHRKPERAPCCF